MRKTMMCLVGMLTVVGLGAGAASAEQTPLFHVSNIDLGEYFNSDTGYGNNPLSVTFDGLNAYVGGYNNTGADATVGVVKVSGLYGGGPMFTPLADTLFSSPNLRGLDTLAFDTGSDSLFMHHDGGSASASFVSRRAGMDGSEIWTLAGPQGSRALGSIGIDPVGDDGSPGVAYLVQGSGRRRLLSIEDGSTIYDGSNGGIINSTPTFFGTAWRGVAFDSEGNIAITEDSGYQYGVRTEVNRWQALDGTNDRTSSSIQKNIDVNNVGQGIAILEDLGSDLLAVSGRNMTTFMDLDGGFTDVQDNYVHLRNIDGTIAGLSQLALTGDEDGIGTPWGPDSDTKSLAFGYDAAGNATLLVLDFVERRLDVYQVPEPATLALLAVGGMALVGRRR